MSQSRTLNIVHGSIHSGEMHTWAYGRDVTGLRVRCVVTLGWIRWTASSKRCAAPLTLIYRTSRHPRGGENDKGRMETQSCRLTQAWRVPAIIVIARQSCPSNDVIVESFIVILTQYTRGLIRMGVHVHIANVTLLGLLEKTGSRRLMVFSGETSPAMSHITGALCQKVWLYK